MSKVAQHTSAIIFIIFAVFAWIVLSFVYGEVLWTAQERDLLVESANLIPVSSYLTQFFYYPCLGALTLVALWALVFFFCQQILNFNKYLELLAIAPVVALFCSIVSVGYKIYCLETSGFFFSYTLRTLALSFVCYILSLFLKKRVSFFRKAEKRLSFIYIIMCMLVAGASCIIGWMSVYKNYAYLAEMRMIKAAEERDWDKILMEAGKSHYPTRSMTLLKNVALLNKCELGERAFEYPLDVNSPDAEALSIDDGDIALPVVYYNYGLENYAMKWAMEKSVIHGMNTHYLKILAKTAAVTGELNVVEKYRSILHRKIFYKDWNDISSSESTTRLYDSRRENYLGGDMDNYERFLVQHYCQHQLTDDRMTMELILHHTMIAKQPAFFWRALDFYIECNSSCSLPKHYQEAYLVFEKYMPSTMSHEVTIDPDIEKRFESFIQNNKSPQFNNTYWWYFYYGRNI